MNPILLAALLVSQAPAAADAPAPLFPFVLPWDDASPGVTNASSLLEAPAGKHGPVVVRDGHFFAGPNRIRFLGVNFCFGANFPRHDDAEKVAARLARFGINCVRFHHMDMMSAPDGIFAADGKTLDPDRLDRLDYLIAQLKKHGIYADLNLHVSRTYPGMPKWEGMPSFHKGVDNFVPKMIEFQRQYARDLLTHENPYTHSHYANEPAVALVEINNENALMQDWWGGRLDAMPSVYSSELATSWNTWLRDKHRDDARLKSAWNAGAEPLGSDILANGDFSKGQEGWYVEQTGEAKAESKVAGDGPNSAPSLRVQVTHPGRENWHIQVAHPGLKLSEERTYTLKFQARSDRPRRIAVNAMNAHAPWASLWSSDLSLSAEWKSYQYSFRPSKSDDNARITFTELASENGELAIAGVSLRSGGVVGLEAGEVLGKIPIFRHADFGSRTAEARRDWIRFLIDVETRYWAGMADFLKKDLGVKAPIVGTQMGWSPPQVQAKMDVIDSHAYWQHPNFPSGDWDPVHWSVKNLPMTSQADGGTLPGLALSRIEGKPFICTEYNHPAPNTYSSEAFLLASAFAASQDWDGLFAFAYSHRRDDWDPKHFGSFFDIDAHPAKMVTMPVAARMFVGGDEPINDSTSVARPTAEELLDATVKAGPYVNAGSFGAGSMTLSHRVGTTLGKNTGALNVFNGTKGPAFSWKHEADGRGVATIDAPKVKAAIGSTSLGPFQLGDVMIAPGKTRQDWAAITISATDGANFHSPGHFLVTATGYVENTGMGWKDAQKSTVGADWGRGPSLVEGIPAEITLPVPASRVRAWPLDERGQKKSPLSPATRGGKAVIQIGPEYKTLWYEIEITPG